MNSILHYIRTDLGEFKVSRGKEEMENILSRGKDLIEEREYMDVETLSGFHCKIRPCDIRICGPLDEYMKILEKGLPKDPKAAQEPIEYDDVNFSYVKSNDQVLLKMKNSKTEQSVTVQFSSDDFIRKVLDELPNAVTDAILDEKERRAFS